MKIAVFLGSRLGNDPELAALIRNFAIRAAKAGVTIIYGGSSLGLMGILADSALEAGGKVIGVMPEKLLISEQAHQHLSEMVFVDDLQSRKTTMYKLADKSITLPGGLGTLDEFSEFLTLDLIYNSNKDTIILNYKDYYKYLLLQIEHFAQQGFLDKKLFDRMKIYSEIREEIFT